MSKKFLSIGDTLINPDQLAYAVFDKEGCGGPRLRLGFASQSGDQGQLRLEGEAAREVLRWLRQNANFLSKPGGLGPIGPSRETSPEQLESESRLPFRAVSCALGTNSELVGHF
jgi:hypothetical protein